MAEKDFSNVMKAHEPIYKALRATEKFINYERGGNQPDAPTLMELRSLIFDAQVYYGRFDMGFLEESNPNT